MATRNVPSVSQTDFEFYYYTLSSPGDTLVLPAGSATWGASSRPNAGVVYLSTAVIVVGQGDSTIITLDDTGKTYANGIIWLGAQVVFKSVKIIGSNAAPVTAFQIAFTDTYDGSGFRISDITYEGGLDGYLVTVGAGITKGLIDSCRITGNVGYAEPIYTKGPGNAWSVSSPKGTINNVFIEDCVFYNEGYVNDGNSNSGTVARFCTMNGKNKIDAHGFASNSQPAASVRWTEAYCNTWTRTGDGFQTNMEIRGGSGIFFGNACIGGLFYFHDYAYDREPEPWPNFGFYNPTLTHGAVTTITTSSPHGYSTGWPVWVQAPLGVVYGFYNITVTGPNSFTIPVLTSTDEVADWCTTYKTPQDYPIFQQVGRGSAGSEPVYAFRNTQNGSPWPRQLGTVCASALAFYRAQTGNPVATFTDSDVIQSNRDIFADAGFDTNTGVTVGTYAQMLLATPTDKHGFWVTDRGNWNTQNDTPSTPGYQKGQGQLFVANGSSWSLYYEPFTYPHPDRIPPADPSVLRANILNVATLNLG